MTLRQIQISIGYAGALLFPALALLSVNGFPTNWFAIYITGITIFIGGTFWSENEKCGEWESICSSLVSVLIIALVVLDYLYHATITACMILVVFLILEKRRLAKGLISIAYYRFRKVATVSAIGSALIVVTNDKGFYL